MTTESQTFSALVDDVISISLRGDRQADIYRYIWQTIRECQVKAFFAADRVEDSLSVDANPFVWEAPNIFRMMETVKYPYYDTQGNPIFPKYITPGKLQSREDYFYYRSGTAFVFGGLEAGVEISISYFVYALQLLYYVADARPARFDLETQTWTYLTAVTDAEKLIAQALSTNWLIYRWYSLILEGTLAKLYKVVGDDRAAASYSLYKQSQNDLMAGEPYESLGR